LERHVHVTSNLREDITSHLIDIRFGFRHKEVSLRVFFTTIKVSLRANHISVTNATLLKALDRDITVGLYLIYIALSFREFSGNLIVGRLKLLQILFEDRLVDLISIAIATEKDRLNIHSERSEALSQNLFGYLYASLSSARLIKLNGRKRAQCSFQLILGDLREIPRPLNVSRANILNQISWATVFDSFGFSLRGEEAIDDRGINIDRSSIDRGNVERSGRGEIKNTKGLRYHVHR
jgi:hypothetical protein